jgi:hypothetical protein
MSKSKKIKRQIERNSVEEEIEVTLKTKDDYVNLIKIILAIVVFLGLAYVYTRTFITKDWTTPEVVEPGTNINYDNIVSQQVLAQKEEVYYVMYTNDVNDSDFISYQIQTSSKELDKMYQVDTTQIFNQDVLTDGDYTTEPATVEEIKIGVLPTLIKVENGKVVDFIEGSDVSAYINLLLTTAEEK